MFQKYYVTLDSRVKQKIVKYVSTLMFFFVITTFILSYFYLKKIEDCECLLKKSDNTFIDIKKLQYVQIALIIIAIIDYFFVLNTHIDKLGLFRIFLLLLILSIYLYFLYNIYYFIQNINDLNCICGNNWERFIIYKQFILYITVFVIIIFTLVFNIEHHLINKLYESSYMKNIYYLIKSIWKK
jgi:hypothetical protein